MIKEAAFADSTLTKVPHRWTVGGSGLQADGGGRERDALAGDFVEQVMFSISLCRSPANLRHWRGSDSLFTKASAEFQAVIKSTASAASPAAEKIVKKNIKKCILGALYRDLYS